MSRTARLVVLARRSVVPLLLVESAAVAAPVPRAGTLVLGAVGLCSGVAALGLRSLREEASPEPEAEPVEATVRHTRRRTRVERVLEGNDFPRMVFQPIVDVRSEAVTGYEALSRFGVGRPDEWFSEAAAVGLGLDLELKAIRRALRSLEALPPSTYLSVNASPQTLASERMRELLGGLDVRRVVVELTGPVARDEHATVARALAHFRARGGRLAMDDLGADHTSLRSIAVLEPDIIKLDRSVTRAMSADGRERAVVAALVDLGHAAGATIVAEGLEDELGLRVARDLGVQAAQGWLLGRPQPLSHLDGRHPSPAVPAPRRR